MWHGGEQDSQLCAPAASLPPPGPWPGRDILRHLLVRRVGTATLPSLPTPLAPPPQPSLGLGAVSGISGHG